MKYIRFRFEGTEKYGIIDNNIITEISPSYFEPYTLLANTYPIENVTILAPSLPSKAVCVGLNYADHAKEMNLTIPSSPVLFMKPSSATIGPLDYIEHPSLSARVDYEGELAIVIKKRAYHVAIDDIGDFILGYTCANDVTARDLQHKDGQWTIAKGFDTFLPLGPIITDEVDPHHLSITTYLNDAVVQKSNTQHLIFSAHYLVSYISQIMSLYPGDVILTGTPGGIGNMEHGDVVKVEIEGIGVLTNTYVKKQ